MGIYDCCCRLHSDVCLGRLLQTSPGTRITKVTNHTSNLSRATGSWATDASYFRVVSWGYYYLVAVMDDYSLFILAWRLQRDMTAHSFIEVVQEAVDRTGMDQVPITDRTRRLSDNGPGYVSRAFRDYLGMVGIKHILASPFHPQTNGKLACRRTDVSWQRAFVRQGDSMTRGARTTVSNRRC